MEGMQIQEMASNLLLEMMLNRDRLQHGQITEAEALRRIRVIRQRRVNKEVSVGVLRHIRNREIVGAFQNLE